MRHPVRRLAVAAALLVAAAVSACEEQVKAPTERLACWHMVPTGAETPPKFNKLPGSYQSLEFCAAALEMVRLQGARQQIAGAYQGQFIFATSRGIFVGQTLTGSRYIALVRTADGRLAIPGAARQP